MEDLNYRVLEKREEKAIFFLRERSEDCPGTFVEKNSITKREFAAVCIS